jgi:uroporphyrinogen-III synthase
MPSTNNSTKVKTLLISQPEPTDIRSPLHDLKEKYKIDITFRPFVKVEGVPARDFRKDKVNILEQTAIILTSRIAIEHLFRMCTEMRIELPAEMKYFCVTEAVALYLQKFITYRKRKVFYPKVKEQELYDLLLKHKTEKYLFPHSDVGSNNEVIEFMKKHNLNYTEAVLYRTVSSDLSDLANVKYDVIAFFSPSGVKSLFENFPDFIQNGTRIAAFGASTCQAIRDAGLRLDIEAPTPQAPSMKMALEEYIRKANK